MSREIYKRSVAPHNLRVGVDGGVPSDNVQAAILLMQDTQPDIDAGLVRLLMSPELFGTKQRASAPYLFATKAYSANSPQIPFSSNYYLDTVISGAGWTKTTDCTVDALGGGEYQINMPTNGGGVYRTISGLTVGKYITKQIFMKGTGTVLLSDPISSSNPVKTVTLTAEYQLVEVSGFLSTADAGIYIRRNGTTATAVVVKFPFMAEVLNADLTQTTANSQPYLDKIAPSEPLGLKNTNGDARFMSHPAISFGAGDKWTYEMVVDLNGATDANKIHRLCRNAATSTSQIRTQGTSFLFINNAGDASPLSGNSNIIVGKKTHLAFVADGTGKVATYINGVFTENKTVIGGSAMLFSESSIMTGGGGKDHHRMLLADTMTASRIAYRAALLRSIFPEIPTVKVAGLDVAVRALDVVCTPAGTVIANVTDNAAWAALTTPAWCHHGNDLALGSVYGKIYNGYAKDLLVADLASSGFGYHVATEAELTAILGAGVAALKAIGANYWRTANGTNLTGLTFLGGAARNSTDGSFLAIKDYLRIWCADSDKTLNIEFDNTTAFTTRSKAYGAYILLIKN